MRHKKGSGMILLGLILIILAFGLTFWNMYDENRVQVSTDVIMGQLQDQIPAYQRADGMSDENQMLDLNDLHPEEQEIPDYRLDPQREMVVKTVDGKPYVGALSIPVLDLELPVIQEWSYSNLRVAPCRYAGSAYTGNLVIAAHNYISHFGNLKRLLPGDAVVFTDMEGNRFHYEVALLETLEPAAVEEMTSGDWDLSLFTCTVGGQLRVTVRCVLIGEEPNFGDLA